VILLNRLQVSLNSEGAGVDYVGGGRAPKSYEPRRHGRAGRIAAQREIARPRDILLALEHNPAAVSPHNHGRPAREIGW
jgi:hypothetical protein